jgi:hypothetical protein
MWATAKGSILFCPSANLIQNVQNWLNRRRFGLFLSYRYQHEIIATHIINMREALI